jgi:histidinol-phosphate aminotransferase
VTKAKQWINPRVQAMKAYTVHDAEGLIKLDAMENPYSWPDDLKQRWLSALSQLAVNRYPDAHALVLKRKIREVMNVPDDMSIMLGNGSDELILVIALAMAQADRIFLAPEPSFVMYEAITAMTGAEYKCVPLDANDFSLDSDAMLAAIKKYQPAVTFLAYPNNPTGNLFDEKIIVEVIKNTPGLVVLDEAYNIFSRKSFIDRLNEFDNCILMRTFSKSGLAGLRLGYLIGSKEWISELEKIRLPYNINSLSQRTAEFVLENNNIFDEQANKICKDREKLFLQLSEIDGLHVWPSEANFILFKVLITEADKIFENLKQQGLLIKNLNSHHSMLSQCLRVTIGTEDENVTFIKALKNSMQLTD